MVFDVIGSTSKVVKQGEGMNRSTHTVTVERIILRKFHDPGILIMPNVNHLI